MSQFGSTVAGAFAAVGAASAAGIGFAVKQASDFESAFAGVRKTVDATEAEYASLSKEIRNMAKEIPASAGEIAKVAEIAGQLGIEKKHLMDFTRTMIDLGVSTNMSAEEAATALARFANITGMSMRDIDRLGSTIVALGNNLATTESEITNMALRLAGAGNQIGLTEAEIMSFAAALSSVGIEAEMGGSAFSRVMLNMNTAVMEGSDNLNRFAKVAGMSAGEFATAFEKDAAGAILAFIKGLGEMSDEGANTAQILDDLGLGEIRVRDSLMRAAGASDVFSKSLKIGNKAWKENTALTKEAQERYKTFASQMKILKNRFNNIMILIGGPFMDALIGIVDALDPVIKALERFAEWFAETESPLRDFIVYGTLLVPVIAAIGAAFGSVLMALGAFSSAMASVPAVLSLTSAVFGTATAGILAFLGVIVGIPAAIAAVIVAIKNWDAIKGWATDLARSVGNAFADMYQYVSESMKNIAKSMSESMKIIAESMKKVAESMLNSLKAVSPALAKFVADSWIRLNKLTAFMSKAFSNIGESLLGFGNTLKGFSVGTFDVVMSGIGKAGEIAGRGLDYLRESGITVADVLRNLAGPITTLIIVFGGLSGPIGWVISSFTFLVTRTNLVSDSIKAFKGEMEFSQVIRNVGDMTAAFIENLAEMISKAIEVGADIIVALIEGIANQLPKVTEVAVKIVTTLIEGFAKSIVKVADVAADVIPLIVDTVLKSIPLILEVGIKLINTLVEAIVSALPLIVEAAVTIITTLIEGFVTVLPKLIEVGLMIIATLIDSIVTVLPKLIEVGLLIISTLIDSIVTVLPLLIELGITIILTLFNALVDNVPMLIESGITILNTLIEGIISALPKIIDAAILLITTMIETIIELLPALIDAGIKILLALIEGIFKILPQLLDAAIKIIMALADAFIQNLPTIIDAGIKILLALIDGIIDVLPQLIDAGIKLIFALAGAIIDNLPKIINAGIKILYALIDGIIDVLPELLKAGWYLITRLVGAIIDMLPELWDAGVKLIGELIKGIFNKKRDTKSAAESIGKAIIKGLPGVGKMIELGSNLIAGLRDGMDKMKREVGEKAIEIGMKINKPLKKFFKMKSPSRKMRDEIGKMIGKGLIVGMDAEMTNIQRVAQRMAEAATPPKPKLAGFDTSDLRSYSRAATNRLQAEMQASGTFEADREQHVLLAEIRDELRRQKQMIIEMDGKAVGRAVEPTVTETQDRKKRIRDSFR
ncbi:phage tail tape measure protein [Virgibacillus proomii]|uniref:phage tail tape measure protein n=1 Tax=Virgibacillus proomii TaxID=84407 RepID=UPI001C101679|nr:phage tail tape measure protein [Virgibacillus proomii]MBU5266302.1 phage tail tape measure protein [Virgibacillus proomii]